MAQSHRDMGGLSRESATAFSSEAPPPTTLRQRALDEIKTVTWDPAWGQERITNMVATRPDWCISRQRIWGVPIAVFLCRKCGEPLRNPEINKRIVSLFAKESADAWYIRTPEDLLPAGTTCACGHTEFRKETDILDVWFESGSSSHAVLDFDPDVQQVPGDPDPRADLYAEGGDQHRGWFMSSLLCSIGMHNRAPFKEVATYGWTLDEQGRALSKSLGNFIDPVAIMDQLGGDIVRLWVASVDFREDVVASLPLLSRLAEEIYRKLRNTFRFLLGALSETDPPQAKPTTSIRGIPMASRLTRCSPSISTSSPAPPSLPAKSARHTRRWNSTASIICSTSSSTPSSAPSTSTYSRTASTPTPSNSSPAHDEARTALRRPPQRANRHL